MDAHDHVLRIIGEIYATIGCPDRWPACLESIRELLQGNAANVLYHDHRHHHGGIVASTISPEASDEYCRYYHAVDPWAMNVSPGTFVPEQVFLGQSLIPHDKIIRTEFYADFGKRFGLTRSIVGVIEASPDGASGVLTLNRPDASPEFDGESARILRTLVPHVRRALALHQEVTMAGVERQALSDVLDQVRAAVVLVDGDGYVVLMNRAASSLVNQRDGFTLDRRRIVGATVEANAALRQSITSMVASARGQTLTPAQLRVRLPRPSGRRALDIQILPLPRGAHGAAVAALFVTDPDATPVLTSQLLAEHFGLTPVESKVAKALAQGLSVTAIAEACRLSTQTTRWYVKQILAKTGTSRQAEVVRLLLSLTPSSVPSEER